MAITIQTVAGNAVISANAANPGLIITPAGEVMVGVDTAVTSADPQQLVSAQNVIDYVQQGGLPTAITATTATALFDGVEIPLTARRVVVSLYDLNPTSRTKAIGCNMVPYVFSQSGGTSGSGACTSLGSSAVSWSTLNAGAAITTTAITTSSYMSGIVTFERLPLPSAYAGEDDVRQYWSVTSQVGLRNTATQFVSSGYIAPTGYLNQPITNMKIRVYLTGGFQVNGTISVVVES